MNNQFNEPWDGYPAELKEMLISLFHDDGAHSHDEVIGYLSETIQGVVDANREDALIRSSWVNELFMFCFDPVVHEGSWRDCAKPALALVKETEQLLSKVCKPRVSSHASFSGDSGELDVLHETALFRNLNAYGAVAAGFADEEEEFALRLGVSLAAVEETISFVASQPNANYLIGQESPIRFGEYFPGLRPWTEPLAYIGHAAPHMGREDDLAKAYREYASFLDELASSTGLQLGGLMEDAKASVDVLESVSETSSGEEWSPF
ncbi:MAG: hypothetical protein IJH04_10490 [Eggerthellaceae bacterium]|nr:hypothetical protein [Eggerthellaceae bacterium]